MKLERTKFDTGIFCPPPRLTSLGLGGIRWCIRLRSSRLVLANTEDSAGIARHEVRHHKVALAHHWRTRRVLRHLVELAAHMLECSARKATHVEAQTQEMRIKQRGQQRVAQEQRTKQYAHKDHHLGIRNKAHRAVIVQLDP